ncbi:E3 ubiquitin-protein ligase MIB2 [Geodia barretti]|uniref:RING-type E3 ubiquitin transferase n=2 Tax=Geodia barretti TaxID=519541 RepID=A0AA35QRT6_GEOBA|nr:E3 ubiquitin-protein ligase MIB2 [Geodia barretti]
MDVGTGIRVVRGPDWGRGNEDGGEGYLGTVVAGGRVDGAEDGRHDVATVQWDVGGERHVYRCGAGGKYDLRVIDSAPAGVVHSHLECSGCGSQTIAGCVWRCVHCLRYYLCTPCYMKDRHSVWHHFTRMDSPENPRQRTRVRCRYLSGRVGARGVFVGARVVRGRDWRWSDQDGGAGREGTVVDVCGWQSESSRSVAVVEWRESALKRKYRLGHKGKVDLQSTVAAEGGHCYLDHLPLLGSEYRPSISFISAGDRVLLEADLIQSSQEEIGAQDTAAVFEILGEVGMVNSVHLDEKIAKVFFQGRGSGVTVATKSLKRVEGPDVFPDDVVRVIDDMAEVHRLVGRAWCDDMALCLGQLGRVERFLNDGSTVVKVNGRRWALDPQCLIPTPGEQPEDEEAEVEPEVGVEMLMVRVLKEASDDLVFKVAAYGNSKLLGDILKKFPEKVDMMYKGKTLLHKAAAEGSINAVRVLLHHKADVAARVSWVQMVLLSVWTETDIRRKKCVWSYPPHSTCHDVLCT